MWMLAWLSLNIIKSPSFIPESPTAAKTIFSLVPYFSTAVSCRSTALMQGIAAARLGVKLVDPNGDTPEDPRVQLHPVNLNINTRLRNLNSCTRRWYGPMCRMSFTVGVTCVS